MSGRFFDPALAFFASDYAFKRMCVSLQKGEKLIMASTELEADSKSIKKLSDADLVTNFLAGDRASFSEIYIRHHEPVLNLVKKTVGNDGIAEELTQECFMKAHRDGLRNYNPSLCSLRSWLCTIGRNMAISHWRSITNNQGKPYEVSWDEKEDPDDPETQRRASAPDTPESILLEKEADQKQIEIVKRCKELLRLIEAWLDNYLTGENLEAAKVAFFVVECVESKSIWKYVATKLGRVSHDSVRLSLHNAIKNALEHDVSAYAAAEEIFDRARKLNRSGQGFLRQVDFRKIKRPSRG